MLDSPAWTEGLARGQLKEADVTASHLSYSLALEGKRGRDKIRKVKCSRADNAMTMQTGMSGSRSAQRAVRGHSTSFPPAAAKVTMGPRLMGTLKTRKQSSNRPMAVGRERLVGKTQREDKAMVPFTLNAFQFLL